MNVSVRAVLRAIGSRTLAAADIAAHLLLRAVNNAARTRSGIDRQDQP